MKIHGDKLFFGCGIGLAFCLFTECMPGALIFGVGLVVCLFIE